MTIQRTGVIARLSMAVSVQIWWIYGQVFPIWITEAVVCAAGENVRFLSEILPAILQGDWKMVVNGRKLSRNVSKMLARSGTGQVSMAIRSSFSQPSFWILSFGDRNSIKWMWKGSPYVWGFVAKPQFLALVLTLFQQHFSKLICGIPLTAFMGKLRDRRI